MNLMNRLKVVLLTVTLICPCAWAREKPDAPQPKTHHVIDRKYFAVMSVLAAAKAADAYATSAAPWPCRETNPILGPNPSDRRIAAFGIISLAVESGTAFLLKRFGQRHRWARYLWLGEPSLQTVKHAHAAMHDANLNCTGTY